MQPEEREEICFKQRMDRAEKRMELAHKRMHQRMDRAKKRRTVQTSAWKSSTGS